MQIVMVAIIIITITIEILEVSQINKYKELTFFFSNSTYWLSQAMFIHESEINPQNRLECFQIAQ